MSRPLRIEYPGAVYHITSRGNGRAQIFTDGKDRKVFLNLLKEVNRRYETRCHAYCLMGNHYHLLLETPRGNLSMAMRQLNGVYTQTFNWLHTKTGHLFQGRYAAILIARDEHLLEAARYVVLNPVRAGIVSRPKDWPWSSYMATAGLAKADACLTAGWLISQFGEEPESARAKYMEFVLNAPGTRFTDEVVSGIVFGSGEFARRCGLQNHRGGNIAEIPKEQRFVGRPDLSSIINSQRKKAGNVIEAVEVYGYTQKAVADELGVHYSAVSKLLSRQMSRFKT